MIQTLFHSAAAALAAAVISSCAGTPQADFLAPGFSPAEVDHVAVLPTIDNRIVKEKQHDYTGWMAGIIEGQMKRKGYECTMHTEPSLVSNVTRSELANPQPSWIELLPPNQDRWVMVMAVNDSTSRLTFGSTGNAEVEGFLFDKTSKRLVWREQAIGRAGQGGLIGMAMVGLMERGAVGSATGSVMATLPKKD